MKKGQVTIFVVLGVLVVVVIVLFVVLSPSSRLGSVPVRGNPDVFLSSCVSDALDPFLVELSEKGGVLNPRSSLNYSFDPSVGMREYSYLCYTPDFFHTCYNLVPLLKGQVEREIDSFLAGVIPGCLDRLESELSSGGSSVSVEYLDHSVQVLPGEVRVDMSAPVVVSGGDASLSKDSFSVVVLSPLFWLVDTAEKIVASESTYCYFDYNAYMSLFPKFNIRRIDFDGSKVYHVIDRASDQTFKFAVRSCAFPLR